MAKATPVSEPEVAPEPETISCPACGGSGLTSNTIDATTLCPNCQGSGLVNKENDMQNDATTEDLNVTPEAPVEVPVTEAAPEAAPVEAPAEPVVETPAS